MTVTIGEILPVAARRFGARTALLLGERSFCFEELEALSNRAANGLVAAGVQSGDRVALFGPNCWEWIVAYYGIAKTGAVIIPVNVMLTPDEVRYVVEDSGASAVVHRRTRASRCSICGEPESPGRRAVGRGGPARRDSVR